MKPRSPLNFVTILAVVFILLALTPYMIVGERWGMIWYYIAAPFSRLTKDFLDFEPFPLIYVLGTTLLAAAAWAAFIYACAKLVQRYTRTPEPGS